MARPVLEEIVAERPDLKVSKINIDEGAELAGCFGMMSIPMLTVMKNGKMEDQGSREYILKESNNEYTRKLLEAVPSLGGERYV